MGKYTYEQLIQVVRSVAPSDLRDRINADCLIDEQLAEKMSEVRLLIESIDQGRPEHVAANEELVSSIMHRISRP